MTGREAKEILLRYFVVPVTFSTTPDACEYNAKLQAAFNMALEALEDYHERHYNGFSATNTGLVDTDWSMGDWSVGR